VNAGEICNREVVFAYRDTGLVEAARLMRELGDFACTVGHERLRETRLGR